MIYRCKLCGVEFEDQLDIYIHLGYGHALIEEVPSSDNCPNVGAFDYCADGPPSCEHLCIRRSTEYQSSEQNTKEVKE